MSNIKSFLRSHFILVSVVLALGLVISWYCVRLGATLYVVNETFNVSLARDAKTGQYLGEVVAQSKDSAGKKVVSYRIKRSDGSVIERSSDEVTVFEP